MIHVLEIRLKQLLSLTVNFQEIRSKFEEIVPLQSLSAEDAEWEAFQSVYFQTFAW